MTDADGCCFRLNTTHQMMQRHDAIRFAGGFVKFTE